MDQVDSKELLNVAIDAMTEYLDPYSVYYPAEDRDDLSVIYDGSYTGLGMNAVKFNGAYTVLNVYPGFAAEKANLIVGDRITHVNTTALSDTTISLRKLLDGVQGDTLQLTVIRALTDTLQLQAELGRVQTKAVPFFCVVEGDVGYIQLARFTRQSQREFRQALHQLYRQTDLQGLIIDIRDNRGGLLQAAVGIAELFLPAGSVIVSTKGRLNNNNAEYKSRLAPMYPELPLTVLINEQSASASEILAAALQDHGRATLLGKQSFGKGLVQNVLTVPYGGQLKLTTARYFTPSGRLLQKIDYKAQREGTTSNDVASAPDGWRAGVFPDIETVGNSDFEVTDKLHQYGLVELFVGTKRGVRSDSMVQEYIEFVIANDFAREGSALEQSYRIRDQLTVETQKQLEPVIHSLQEELRNELLQHQTVISETLNVGFAMYNNPFDAAMRIRVTEDSTVATAKNHLLSSTTAAED